MLLANLPRKIKIFFKRPKVLVVIILQYLSPLLSDEIYLKLLFYLYMGYKLDLNQPKTYNEKLQWLKVNFRIPLMTKMVDKFEAKKVISDKIGTEYVVKNYGIWDSFKDIDFNLLPDKFVLKTTHDQGGVVICRNKSSFNYFAAEAKINKHLRKKHFFLSREWPYKNVKPRIIAEELLFSRNENIFKDFKFYCFNGEPKIMYISSGKEHGRMVFDFYDMDFNLLNIKRPGIPNSNQLFVRPSRFSEMIELSKKISSGFPHIRIDFYEIDSKLYIGELTFFQGGGLMPFIPEEWDNILGSWINLDI